MALIVETGSGASDSESYSSVADCAAYAGNHGLAFPTTDTSACEVSLRKATGWLDARFGRRYPGIRQYGREQRLEWPRSGACDAAGWAIDANLVPHEVIEATCEAAIRELAEPGTLSPDLERGGAIKRLAAGSVEIEYADGAPAVTLFRRVDEALAGLLAPVSPYSGRAVRG